MTTTSRPATLTRFGTTLPIVGWYHLPESRVMRNDSFECAAWWVETLIPAGDYPIIDYDERYPFTIVFTGTVERDYFQSLSCGTKIGKAYDGAQNHGNAGEHCQRMARSEFYRCEHCDYPNGERVSHGEGRWCDFEPGVYVH